MLKDLSKTYNEDQTQLVTQDIDIQLPMSKPEYKSMLANIKDHAPVTIPKKKNNGWRNIVIQNPVLRSLLVFPDIRCSAVIDPITQIALTQNIGS